MEIPKESRKAPRSEPRSLLIYAAPKIGKTSIVAQIPNSLLVEMERGGADAVDARVIEINNPNDLKPLFAQLKDENDIEVIVLDTLSKMDEWSEITGTESYQKKPQGKAFNVANGKRLPRSHPAWDSVHSLGQGFGYRYSRDEMKHWYNQAINTNKTVVFLAHIKDKFIESASGDVVETSEIDLTGKVKGMLATRIDAIASLKREGSKSYLVFEHIKQTAGSRYSYLKGKILIGESDKEGNLTTHWKDIFPSLYKEKKK